MRTILCILFLSQLLCSCGGKSTPFQTTSDDTLAHTDHTATQPLLQDSDELDTLEQVDEENTDLYADEPTKMYVFLSSGDSIMHLTANMRNDHSFFGYAQPDLKAERLILFSIFTNEVKDNPFGCKLGAYYQTSEELTLKYIATQGDFVKAIALDKTGQSTTVYFQKQWITLD